MKKARNVESELRDVNEWKMLSVSDLLAWKCNRVRSSSFLIIRLMLWLSAALWIHGRRLKIRHSEQGQAGGKERLAELVQLRFAKQ